MRKTTSIVVMLIIAASLGAAVAAWLDTFTVTLRTAEVLVPGLTSAARILHVSDLHGVTFGPEQSGLAAALQGQHFDVAVINGDHTPTADAGLSPVLDLLAVLQDHADAVFVTRGNHDTDAVIEALAAAGAIVVEPGDDAVALITDAGRINVTPALRPGDAPDSDLTLAVGHYPMSETAIEEAAREHPGVAIFLFGHAHGGQIRLPLLGALWAPGEIGSDGRPTPRVTSANFFPELQGRTISGLSRVGAAYRHISNGLGTQAIRLRFLAPAEMTAITLLPR